MKNKMTTLLGKAFGAVALAAALSAQAGDIRSIYAVPTEQHAFPNLEDPARVGETVTFDILLANRLAPGQVRYSDSVTNSWVVRYKGAGTEAYDAQNNPLKIGVIVNGRLREAALSLRPHGTYGSEYTVMHVSYTARAGDLAMPLKLADSSGSAAPSTGTPTYYLVNADLWAIVDDAGNNPIQFCFGNVDPDIPGELVDAEIRDMYNKRDIEQ